MSRWTVAILALVLVMAAAAWRLWLATRNSGPIIIYIVDALRPDRMSVYGASRDTTPAARALAMEGVVYENDHAVSTWTRPSVATMLTSRLPAEVGAINRFGRLADSVPYLPEMLRARGWHTVSFQSNGNVFDGRLGFDRGFDKVVPIYGHGALGAGELLPHAGARDVVAPAVEFIQEQRSPKFFLFLHVLDTHVPIRVDHEYAEFFGTLPAGSGQRDQLLLQYDRAARQADDQFARLADALRKKGWWHQSLIVYTADHGEELLEHGGVGHGSSLFEEQIRVPLIIKYPRSHGAGTRRSDPVSHLDLAPTIADSAGLGPLPGELGRPLNGSRFESSRFLYLTEDLDDARLFGMISGKSKAIVGLCPKFSRQLFDLVSDPGEVHGIPVACGEPEPAGSEGLFRALRARREDEVRSFPAVRVEKKAGGAAVIRIVMNLEDNPKPFLRDTDACRFSANIANGSLRLEEKIGEDETFELVLGGNDRGDPVVLDVEARVREDAWRRVAEGGDGIVRLIPASARFMRGPTADQMLLQNLRSLGYIH